MSNGVACEYLELRKTVVQLINFNYLVILVILLLKECLFQAVKEKMYSTVAALVFVTDRFSYWQGSSHTTLQLVEYLKTNSPGTAIAPQLLIRKVRVMKNAGDLHGILYLLASLSVRSVYGGI